MSQKGRFQRRAMLGGLSALACLAWSSRSGAQLLQGGASAGTHFRTVAFDGSGLSSTGGGSVAAAIEPAMLAKMREVFADLLVPGDRQAPVLVARINHLFLTSYQDRGLAYSGDNDNIEGDGVILAGRQILSTTHVLTELSPSYSGAWYLPDIDQKRLDSLAYQFAYWLRRNMNI